MKINKSKNDSILKEIVSGTMVSLGISAITSSVKMLKTFKTSKIDVGEWDSSYQKINKILYELKPNIYIKHRAPAISKDFYELEEGTSYIIKLTNGNYIKVDAYRNKHEKIGYAELRIKLLFFGKEKYRNRENFLLKALRITDDKHIRVQHLNEFEMSCDIIPHSFDNIILDDKVKNNIINGLSCWHNSKSWYEEHQLVHKIGVFLYGKPGTGKSTIAKAISSMFNNAPILTIDNDNIIRSINGIFKMRKRYDDTIIILIEDFDLYFKSREESVGVELDIEQKKQKDTNLNAIFQLLDGIYSTENTIYIATTNYKERIDLALIRHGRFDIQEEMEYFDYFKACECVRMFGYGKDLLDDFKLEYPVQPAYLQSKVMEYRAKNKAKGDN